MRVKVMGRMFNSEVNLKAIGPRWERLRLRICLAAGRQGGASSLPLQFRPHINNNHTRLNLALATIKRRRLGLSPLRLCPLVLSAFYADWALHLRIGAQSSFTRFAGRPAICLYWTTIWSKSALQADLLQNLSTWLSDLICMRI